MPMGPATVIAMIEVATVPNIGPELAAMKSTNDEAVSAGIEPATSTIKIIAKIPAVVIAPVRAIVRNARSGENKLRDPVRLNATSLLLSRV